MSLTPCGHLSLFLTFLSRLDFMRSEALKVFVADNIALHIGHCLANGPLLRGENGNYHRNVQPFSERHCNLAG